MTSTSQRAAQRGIGLLAPIALAVIGIGPILVRWGSIPASIPSHWSGGAHPDGSTSKIAALVLSIVVVAVASALLVGVAYGRRRSLQGATSIGGASALIGSLIGEMNSIVAWRSIGHADWHTVTVPTGLAQVGLTLALLVVPIAFATVVCRWISVIATNELVTGLAVGTITARPGERVVWAERLQIKPLLILAKWMTAVGVGIVILNLTAGILGRHGWTFGVELILVALVMTCLASIRVRADQAGLHISYGLAGWPRQTIKAADISLASAIDIRPIEWGGWGYRGSLRVFRRAAIVLRKGEGIRLDLRNNKVFVVTISDAETGAAVLNGLAHR